MCLYTANRIKEDKKSVVEKVLIHLFGEGINVDEEIEYQFGGIDNIPDDLLFNTVIEHDIEV